MSMPQRLVINVAESLAAGAAVGYGARILADIDLIVSIVAGLLVAASAGVSLYLNIQRRKEETKNNSD